MVPMYCSKAELLHKAQVFLRMCGVQSVSDWSDYKIVQEVENRFPNGIAGFESFCFAERFLERLGDEDGPYVPDEDDRLYGLNP